MSVCPQRSSIRRCIMDTLYPCRCPEVFPSRSEEAVPQLHRLPASLSSKMVVDILYRPICLRPSRYRIYSCPDLDCPKGLASSVSPGLKAEFPSLRWTCLKRVSELHLPRFEVGLRVFPLLGTVGPQNTGIRETSYRSVAAACLRKMIMLMLAENVMNAKLLRKDEARA